MTNKTRKKMWGQTKRLLF